MTVPTKALTVVAQYAPDEAREVAVILVVLRGATRKQLQPHPVG